MSTLSSVNVFLRRFLVLVNIYRVNVCGLLGEHPFSFTRFRICHELPVKVVADDAKGKMKTHLPTYHLKTLSNNGLENISSEDVAGVFKVFNVIIPS